MNIDKPNLDMLRAKTAFISDMDGVIYHGNRLLPGVKEFFAWLIAEGKEYLFLTNSSERSPRELHEKLSRLGLEVPEEHFYTSAMSTALFLSSQKPGGSAYVIGEPGLINALYNVGYSMNDVNPDYVVLGETTAYNYDTIKKATRLVMKGAKLIGTNPDISGPGEDGIVPATGALTTPIEMVARVKAYYPGKPNPLMMRNALKKMGCRREETAIVGDRMDTDILSGIESEIDTVLVLSGVTSPDDLNEFAYRPKYILENVGMIPAG
jgi:NagD protein